MRRIPQERRIRVDPKAGRSSLWHALASVAEMLPEPPITRNQVELMQLDNVASPGAPGFGDLGISSTSLEDALPAIVGL